MKGSLHGRYAFKFRLLQDLMGGIMDISFYLVIAKVLPTCTTILVLSSISVTYISITYMYNNTLTTLYRLLLILP